MADGLNETEFTTEMGCTVQVLDGVYERFPNDSLLVLHMRSDGRRAEVLLTPDEKTQLVRLLTGAEGSGT